MEQHRIDPMLYSNTSIVSSLETDSSPDVETTLGLHILQIYPYSNNILSGILFLNRILFEYDIRTEDA